MTIEEIQVAKNPGSILTNPSIIIEHEAHIIRIKAEIVSVRFRLFDDKRNKEEMSKTNKLNAPKSTNKMMYSKFLNPSIAVAEVYLQSNIAKIKTKKDFPLTKRFIL